MKKIFLFVLIAILLFIAGSYLLIPGTIRLSSTKTIKTTDIGTERFLMDANKWQLWWGDDVKPGDSASATFTQNGNQYHLAEKYYKAADILIAHEGKELHSKMLVIPLALDSTGIEWKCNLPAGNNPIGRISAYFDAQKIKKNMDTVLKKLSSFLSKVENVYGIPIERNYLKDTLYVTGKKTLTARPSLLQIYDLIHTIEAYALQNGTRKTGSPIYNVTTMGDNRYQLMAGIPVDKNIPEKDGFSLKHMVRGSFIITEVQGGDNAVNKAAKSLQQYFADYRKTSMAMNFTMLVTDRLYQPDSTQWITKLYQPVY